MKCRGIDSENVEMQIGKRDADDVGWAAIEMLCEHFGCPHGGAAELDRHRFAVGHIDVLRQLANNGRELGL